MTVGRVVKLAKKGTMGGKWALGILSVIAVAAVAGVGFAAYTSSATLTVNASAGSFYIVASASLGANSIAVGSCSAAPSGNNIVLTLTNLLPGDYCNFTNAYTDAGSLPGNYVSYTPGPFTGAGCSQFSVYAPWTTSPVATVSPSGTAAAGYWNITDTGNGAVSGSCTMGPNTLTYSAA